MPPDLPRAHSSVQSQATVPNFREKRSADRAGPCSCMHRSVNSSSVIVWSPSMSSLLGEGNAEPKSGKRFQWFFAEVRRIPLFPEVSVQVCIRTSMYPCVSLSSIRFGWCWFKVGVKPMLTLDFRLCIL